MCSQNSRPSLRRKSPKEMRSPRRGHLPARKLCHLHIPRALIVYTSGVTIHNHNVIQYKSYMIAGAGEVSGRSLFYFYDRPTNSNLLLYVIIDYFFNENRVKETYIQLTSKCWSLHNENIAHHVNHHFLTSMNEWWYACMVNILIFFFCTFHSDTLSKSRISLLTVSFRDFSV